MGNNKIYGLLGLARRAGKISFGTESSIETIEKKKGKLVIVAEDCSDRTKNNFEELCKKLNVELRIVGTIELLSQSIESIINIKEENDIDSLFRSGGTTMLKNDITGLEDFELIDFMVVI